MSKNRTRPGDIRNKTERRGGRGSGEGGVGERKRDRETQKGMEARI